MGKVTIYHNPRCNTSRTVLKLLEAEGLEPSVVLYLEKPPSAWELSELIRKAGIKPIELVRRKEPIARELGIGQKDYSDAELVALMVKHPILIERPIVVNGGKVVVARPPERVHEVL